MQHVPGAQGNAIAAAELLVRGINDGPRRACCRQSSASGCAEGLLRYPIWPKPAGVGTRRVGNATIAVP